MWYLLLKHGRNYVNSWHHAVSAARKWGGNPEDYIEIETFIDSSKAILGDVRHRAVYHHTEGVFLCERIFGHVITVSKKNGHGTVDVPVRLIAERHIKEDLGWIPSPADYLKRIDIQQNDWMSGGLRKELGNFEQLFNGGNE